MKLAFISIEDVQDVRSWSGTPHFVLKELQRRGIDVEVISPLSRRYRYWYVPHKIIAKLTGRSLQIMRHPIALRSFARQIEHRLKRKQIDAIFSTSSVPISRLRAGVPVLYWTDAVIEGMSDYYHGDFANLSQREMRIAHDQEQAAMDRCSFAIYSSNWAARTVKNFYKITGDKVQIIEFGANLPVDHDINDIVRFTDERLSLKKPECILLFIGVDWERKGGALAFEAARLLNERGIKTVLKVAGCDAPEASFVERLGFISKHTPEGQLRIKNLLATSTFLILPTRAEASAIVYCEAAAYGLPALSTKTGGVEDYVIDSQTGYCLPLEATGSAYADLIAKTCAEPETYRRLSLGAFERYKQILNWDVAVSSLLDLTERAIRGNRPQGASPMHSPAPQRMEM